MMIGFADIEAAAARLSGISEVTPLDHSRTLSHACGADVYIKLENLQRTGSFKIRGAYNRLATLPVAERSRGVIAASAGNHAQGVAFAAKAMGVPCVIVMPAGASLSKVEATRDYGADVVLCGESYDDAHARAREMAEEDGLTFVHAFDDEMVMAGQGTVGLELLRQMPDLDAIVVPVGGGGLIAGIAIAARAIRPGIRIYGVEAAGAACFRASLDKGERTRLENVATIADGIAVKLPGALTWEIVRTQVDDVVTVEDEEIARAMVLLLERMKVVSEGASAAAVAAVLARRLPLTGSRTAVVLSGGNVDVSLLSRIIEHGLVAAGRYIRFSTTLSDRPGALSALLAAVAESGANVVSVEHYRLGEKLVLGQVEVELAVETRNRAHIGELWARLTTLGYSYTVH